MLMCAYHYPIAHETAGAARTRSSLRPLFSGAERLANFGRIAPRDREVMFERHCEERSCPPKPAFGRRRMRRSNPTSFVVGRKLDCFASLAMTVVEQSA